MGDDAHQIIPFPRARRLITDVGRVGSRRPVIRGLLEVDVTEPRERIRQFEEATGERLSFTAFLAACAGQAIEAHKHVHASRDWRGRLVVFDDVDISTLVEVERDGQKLPVGHIVRAANRKNVREIHDEIRQVQHRPSSEKNVRRLLAISRVPSFLRRAFLRAVERSPHWSKSLKGTVVLTAVGMFGKGVGWGLALPTHSLGITVGGIAEKPGIVDGRIEPREFLHVTLDFDHDIVDGAPAARFAQYFSELVERAEGLPPDAGTVQ